MKLTTLILVTTLAGLAQVASANDAPVSRYLYLNRCKGGCTVHGGFDDAKAMSSSIPCPGGASCGGGSCNCPTNPAGDYVLAEFEDSDGNIGTAADAEWNQIVQCVREVYSPYDMIVSDTIPADGSSYNEGIVAGDPQSIGYSSLGGIAPGAMCGPRDNIISYTFANTYAGSGLGRVLRICGTVAQETGHAYGLDHAYKFSNGQRACADPMTYAPLCGQQFFRNDFVTCGEWGPRNCKCGGTQNSHKTLLNIFGPGTPLTAPPDVAITNLTADQTIGAGMSVVAHAYAQRGVARVELWLNGYKWNEAAGVPYGSNGQPAADYAIVIPLDVPDSILDITVKAFDDIGAESDASVTVTKGSACADASTCALGQSCEDGRCFWPTPTGETGATCTYDQFCISNECIETTAGSLCSKECIVGVTDSCPMDFTCEGAQGGTGYCLPAGSGSGGCTVGGDRRAALLLAFVTLGVLFGRRRRR